MGFKRWNGPRDACLAARTRSQETFVDPCERREPCSTPARRRTSSYHEGKSFEELRLEDYELGRDAGRWWPGGMLQVKARSTSSFENLAADLETLRLI